jgi:DNA polymerase
MEKFNLKDNIEGISKIHGKVFKVSTLFGVIKIIPLYHPAVATYNANMKDILKQDFLILKKLVGD